MWTVLATALVVASTQLMRRLEAPAMERWIPAAFAATSVVLNAPFAEANYSGWRWTFAFHARRTPSWGSLWFWVFHDAHLRLHFARSTTAALGNMVSAAALALGVVAVDAAMFLVVFGVPIDAIANKAWLVLPIAAWRAIVLVSIARALVRAVPTTSATFEGDLTCRPTLRASPRRN